MEEMKKCTKCGELKGLDSFHNNNKYKDGKAYECRDCAKTRGVKWRAGNREKANTSNRKWRAKNREKLKTHDRSVRRRFQSLRRSAKTRSIDVRITEEEWTTLVQDNKCFYCNGVLPETGSGVDRLDSTMGYELNNCVPCCKICNTVKNQFDLHFLVKHIRKMKDGLCSAVKKLEQMHMKRGVDGETCL